MIEFEHPTVTCDTSLGRVLDDLEFDVDHIAEVMCHHGVAEDDIAAHIIHLSSEAVSNDVGGYLMGEYDYMDNVTTVYIGSQYQISSQLWEHTDASLSQREQREGGKFPKGTLQRIVSNVISMSCNETLLHETHHAIEGALVSKEEWEEARKQRWDAKEWAQEKKKSLLMTIATLAMTAPIIEAYEGVSPDTLEKTGIASLIIVSICAVWASLPESRKRQHRHYHEGPWEIAARDFAQEFVDDDTEISELPLKIRFKRPDAVPA